MSGSFVRLALGLSLAIALAGCRTETSPNGKDFKEPSEQLPTVLYEDFKNAANLPDGLQYRNLQNPEHLQFAKDGLQIKVRKPHAIPGGRGLGLQTTFGLKGDFDITATFENFKADTPPSGTGVGLGLCIASTEKGEGVQIARVVRPHEQGILWSGKEGTARGRLTASNEKTGRFRFIRAGSTLYSLWAPGSQGDNFQTLDQSELGTNDIRSVWVNVFTAGMAMDIEARLLDWRIRGQKETNPVFDSGKSPTKGPPSPAMVYNASKGWLVGGLLIGLVTTLLLALGVWFLVRRRKTAELLSPGPSVSAPEPPPTFADGTIGGKDDPS